MSVYFDKNKKRWRFDFSRRLAGQRYRASKLLPAGWSRNQAEAYDRAQCASLYAQATGVEKPRLPLAGAVKLYLDHRIPQLKNGKKAAQDLAHLFHEIEASWLNEVAELATRYELTHPELAPGTIRNRLSYLKAAVRYAYRKHAYGDRDYTDRMMLPTANNERQRYEKLPALNKLWRALPPEARALFKGAFYMGLRWRAEFLPRKPEDVAKVDGGVPALPAHYARTPLNNRRKCQKRRSVSRNLPHRACDVGRCEALTYLDGRDLALDFTCRRIAP